MPLPVLPERLAQGALENLAGSRQRQRIFADIDAARAFVAGDQATAVGESKAFELGASNVSLNDVMVDMQKANLGFQFGLQVRNKLVSAYNEIMQTAV